MLETRGALIYFAKRHPPLAFDQARPHFILLRMETYIPGLSNEIYRKVNGAGYTTAESYILRPHRRVFFSQTVAQFVYRYRVSSTAYSSRLVSIYIYHEKERFELNVIHRMI